MSFFQNHWRLLLILLLAIVLRLVSLDDHSLWYDEAFAVLFSEKGVDAMIYGTLTPVQGGAADIHPLLYYVTLDFWMEWVGNSAFVVRLWSVILGVMTVYIVYRLGDRLFGRDTGLAAALITAIAPYHIHYSQETRMYSLLALLLLSAVLCFVQAQRAVGRSRWGWWIGFGLLAGLAMYTQQLAAFFLVSLGLVPFLQRRKDMIPGLVLGTATAILLYLPWLLQIPAQLAKVQSYYWIERPGIDKIFSTLYVFLTNYAEIQAPLSLVALAGAIILFLLSIIQLVMALRRRKRWHDGERASVWLVFWLFAAPLGLMWLVSQIQPVFLERGLIASAVMLYVFLGWVFTRGGFPRFMVVFLTMIGLMQVGIGLWAQYNLTTFPYSPHHEMIQIIRDNWQDGDRVVHMNKLSVLPGVYYGRDLDQHYLGDAPGSPEDTLAVPTQEILGIFADQCMEEAAAHAERIWFLTYDRAEQQYSSAGRIELQAARDFLEVHYSPVDTIQIGDLNAYLYVRITDFVPECSLSEAEASES